MSFSKNQHIEIKCLQYELWQDCNNGCPFCYLNHNRILTNNAQKIANIEKVIENLDSELNSFNAVGLIGGEFFQGQMANEEVKSKWLEMIKVIYDKMQKEEIYEFWITASLMQKDLTDLYDTLSIFQELKENQRILLCTSYDTMGRFKSKEQEQVWKDNIKELSKRFPNVTLHTQIILSQDLIETVLREGNIFKDFIDISMIDFKIPNYYRDKELAINGIKDYHQLLLDNKHKFPNKFFIESRDDFIEFLPIFYDIFGGNKLRNLINYPKLRSHTLKIFSEDYTLSNRWEYEEERYLDCGHLLDGKCYINSEECMYCDIEMFLEEIEG